MTTNEGKVYSNGLALQLYANLSLEEITQINKNVVALLQRVLTFPMVTVAAINGVCCACVCVRARACHMYHILGIIHGRKYSRILRILE